MDQPLAEAWLLGHSPKDLEHIMLVKSNFKPRNLLKATILRLVRTYKPTLLGRVGALCSQG